MKNKIKEVFAKYFSSVGKEIRDEQEKVIINVLEGKNTVCLMPTGGGKSLCYWVAGKALGGVTIVVFPLTALMDEQAMKLQKHGCKVFVLHSGISSKQQYEELISLYNGDRPDFIFLSPERLSTDGFLESVLRRIKDDIKLVVIDEIHCISQWGFDFRPFYKEIPYFLDNIFGDKKPTILGLTATINQEDREEFCKDFDIKEENVLRSRYLLRYNIQTKVVKVENEDKKDEMFWKLLEEKKNEKILVYLDRKDGKRSTETLCEEATSRGFKADYFHADRTSEKKAEIIEKFKNNETMLVFATSAFGMGIDIPDIRGVIHYLPTESIEQYYQQIGRVGRDRKISWACLFYSDKNIKVKRDFFIDKAFPSVEEIKEAFTVLTDNKIGKKTVNYFQETNIQTSYHYLLRSSLVEVVTKGVQSLSPFGAKVPPAKFTEYIDATKTKMLITTAKKLGISEKEICENIFKWLAEKKIKAINAPDKCLVVQSNSDAISEDKINEILNDINIKKQYKHQKLDEFLALVEGFQNHTTFQEAIGEYLGIDRWELTKRYQTLSGEMVRSKSEVIIANILTERGIAFIYEPELKSSNGEMYRPDFEIASGGKIYYWEHLGMIDNEEYLANWQIKKEWYDKYFPSQLIITEESAILSKTAEDIVNRLFI